MQIVGVYARGAQFIKAFMSGVRLHSAILSLTRFKNNTLTGVDLRQSVLTEAVLLHVDLKKADLTGADFEAAEIYNSKGLTSQQLAKAEKLPCRNESRPKELNS